MTVEVNPGLKAVAVTNRAAHVADVGIPTQQHNRFMDGITASVRKRVLFTELDNVRAYRLRARRVAYDIWQPSTAYTLGTIVHPTYAHNLVFEVTAVRGTGVTAGTEPAWPDVVGESVDDDSTAGTDGVTWTARPADMVHLRVLEDAINDLQADSWLVKAVASETDDVEYKTVYDEGWTEWVEFSRDPADSPLSRLDFLAVADVWEVEVETR